MKRIVTCRFFFSITSTCLNPKWTCFRQKINLVFGASHLIQKTYLFHVHESNISYSLSLSLTLQHSQISDTQRHSRIFSNSFRPRYTHSELQTVRHSNTANKNTFIVWLPSFGQLYFLWTSMSTTTHRHTRSVCRQTHTPQLCAFVDTRTYTHTCISKTWSLITSLSWGRTPVYTDISSNTQYHSTDTFVLYIPTLIYIYITNIYEHCNFVLTFPRQFCFRKIFLLTFLLWNVFSLFSLYYLCSKL